MCADFSKEMKTKRSEESTTERDSQQPPPSPPPAFRACGSRLLVTCCDTSSLKLYNITLALDDASSSFDCASSFLDRASSRRSSSTSISALVLPATDARGTDGCGLASEEPSPVSGGDFLALMEFSGAAGQLSIFRIPQKCPRRWPSRSWPPKRPAPRNEIVRPSDRTSDKYLKNALLGMAQPANSTAPLECLRRKLSSCPLSQ